MYKLQTPQYCAEESFDACTTNMSSPKKAETQPLKPDLLQAESEYKTAALSCSLHDFPYDKMHAYSLDNDKIKELYKSYLLSKRHGRNVYTSILSQARSGFCPYCEHGQVGELDHFLPKSEFPILSIIPLNLVPSCERCNKRKHHKRPLSANEVFLHPYFEKTGANAWLTANLEEFPPYILRFTVANPGDWDDLKFQRVSYQFDTLDLQKIYGAQAAAWLDEEIYNLFELFKIDNGSSLKAHLLDILQPRQSLSRETRFKVWQVPMWTALINNDWFCRGGVEQVFQYFQR